MEEKEQSSTGGRRRCGYQYMTPSYVPLGDEENSYLVVSDALLENSSAHGLPTFYQARGLRFFIVRLISRYPNARFSVARCIALSRTRGQRPLLLRAQYGSGELMSVSVCLSVCKHISETTRRIFTVFSAVYT